jgi:predicted DNA-binding protein with PD1-like motif
LTSRVYRSEKSRNLILRVSVGETLPDALTETLRDEHVGCGWLRGSGVVEEVELRTFDPELGTLGGPRRIAGRVQVIALDGSIGLAEGQPTLSLRALLARETDRGLEAIAGEIASARAVAMEVLVTALDDVALGRALDPYAGVWLLGAASADAPGRAGWSAALEVSAEAAPRGRNPGAAGATQPGASAPIPPRRTPPRPDLDVLVPEAGDVVDHFAFGPCDVVKSDGDRLHLRVHKDGRIREIAVEMLRVTRLAGGEGEPARFKLERRI